MALKENKPDSDCSDNIPPIYVVSGGKGMAANTLVRSVLIQFPDNRIPLIVVPNVDSMDKINDTVTRAKESCGVIVHTMVDPLMREILLSVCESYKVKHFDLVGGLSDYISDTSADGAYK